MVHDGTGLRGGLFVMTGGMGVMAEGRGRELCFCGRGG